MFLFCLKGTPNSKVVQMLWSFLKLFWGGPNDIYWKMRFTEGANLIMIGMVTFIRHEEPSGSITLESSSRSPSHNNVVLRSNDAKGLLIFCAMKSANKFFFFFLQFENISAEFRNLTATRSHSQLLDERWCVRRNHFCKLLFWDQPLTRHVKGTGV